MRVAFLYIAEAYQCYHAAAIALELAGRPGISVTSYYNDPEAPYHLERIRSAYGAPPHECRPLGRSRLTAWLQSLKVFGLFKPLVLRDNIPELEGYDLIVAPENSVAVGRSLGLRRPRMIYYPHGFGDRARGFIARIRAFDWVLLAGPKTRDRMLAERLIRPDNHALVGMVKLETANRLHAAQGRLFAEDRPVVLYNAHKARGLESWSRFIEPMLAGFAAQDRFNLIVAPHVKMFRRKAVEVRAAWEARSTGHILIDTGSDHSLDMSYTRAASIYVGDVSSQVYEFLVEPRPCVFLNAHGIDWRGNPSFRHWELGDVIDDPADLMRAIEVAPARHHLYRERQEQLAAASIGDRSPGAARRAAEAILGFMTHR